MGWFTDNAPASYSTGTQPTTARFTGGSTPTAPTIGLNGPGNPNYNPAISAMPLQATSLPTNYNSGPVDPQVASMVANYIQSNGLQASQSDPASLNNIVTYLRSQGVNAQVDATDQNGHTGGILVNGQPYQLINGSNQWTPLQPWDAGGGSGGAQTINGIPGIDPSYQFRFDQGMDALQKSAASKGTLLTGGTLKGLVNYGQGMASTEYGADFGRQLSLASLGENAAAGQGYNNSGYATSATNALTNNANAQAAGSIAQGNNLAGTITNLGSLINYGTGSSGYGGYY